MHIPPDMPAFAGATHPGGTGPTRVKLIIPERPALVPPVKLNCSEAVLQVISVTVADPTATAGTTGGESNTPPVDS